MGHLSNRADQSDKINHRPFFTVDKYHSSQEGRGEYATKQYMANDIKHLESLHHLGVLTFNLFFCPFFVVLTPMLLSDNPGSRKGLLLVFPN